jgi:hypothetical protein
MHLYSKACAFRYKTSEALSKLRFWWNNINRKFQNDTVHGRWASVHGLCRNVALNVFSTVVKSVGKEYVLFCFKSSSRFVVFGKKFLVRWVYSKVLFYRWKMGMLWKLLFWSRINISGMVEAKFLHPPTVLIFSQIPGLPDQWRHLLGFLTLFHTNGLSACGRTPMWGLWWWIGWSAGVENVHKFYAVGEVWTYSTSICLAYDNVHIEQCIPH